MKKYLLVLMAFLLMLSVLTSCRPPELEGAYVDYNAGRIDNALKLAEEAVKKYPDNSEAWYLLGEIYGKKDRFSEMIDAYDKSAAVDQKYTQKIEQQKLYYYQTLFNKGVNNYNKFSKAEDRDSEEAKKALDLAIENFNNANMINEDYKATSLVALAYNLKGDKENAIKYFEKCTVIKPDTADAWISLGNMYFLDQEYDKAIEVLNKAVKIAPEDIEAVSLLSQSYDLNGDKENAIKQYEKAIQLNPEEKAFPFNLGLIYYRMANEEGVSDEDKKTHLGNARKNFGRVVGLDEGIKEAHQLKSSAEIQLQNFEDALKTLTKAVEIFPEDGEMWYYLGVAQGRLGNSDEAKNAFKKADDLGYKL